MARRAVVGSIDDARRRHQDAAGARVPPNNLQAEESLLGAMLLSSDAIATAVEAQLRPDDFYKPAHGHIFAAVTSLFATGEPSDPVTVSEVLRRAGLLGAIAGPATLISLQAGTPSIGNAGRYARIVEEHSLLRRLIWVAGDIAEIGYGLPGDVPAAIDRSRALLAEVEPVRAAAEPDPDLDAFLAGDEPEHDWLVPGLLERQERIILTGGEGAGKSTLLRQLGVQCAGGVHPFTMEPMPPIRVLVVDLENARAHVRRALGPLRLACRELGPGMLVPIVHPEGLNLLAEPDRAWLAARVAANRPDLLIIGPLYKMADGDPNEEQVAKAVSRVLDDMRARWGCAVVIEAHVGHGNRGARPLRPIGASLWLRWPEFGLNLCDDGSLRHWRGPRDERAWPARLRRGGPWPWTVAEVEHVGSDAERVLVALRAQPFSLTRDELVRTVGGRAGRVRTAVDGLVQAGAVMVADARRRASDGRELPVKVLGESPTTGVSDGDESDGGAP